MSSMFTVFSKYFLNTEHSFRCRNVGNVTDLQICNCVCECVVVFFMIQSSSTTYFIMIIEFVLIPVAARSKA
jgi:hypothetical protein